MLAKKVLYSLVVVAVIAALSIGGLALASGTRSTSSIAQAAPAADRSITVVGVGKATGKPDVAHVTVGVETQASSLQQAVDDNKTKMTSLLDTLKKLGLADKDIQTSNYSIYTERATPPTSGANVAVDQLIYHVTNQVDVTVRDVSQVGNVLDKAVAAGANNVYGVSFSVADTTQLESDARSKAVDNARRARRNWRSSTACSWVKCSALAKWSVVLRIPWTIAPRQWAAAVRRCSPASWKSACPFRLPTQ